MVCRAGASTITEITALGLVSILIPYPHATMAHQDENARLLEKSGAAVVIEDKDLSGEVLAEAIVALVSDPARMGTMSKNSRDLGKPDAAREIAGHLRDIVGRKGRLRRLATVLGDICSAR